VWGFEGVVYEDVRGKFEESDSVWIGYVKVDV